MIRTFDFLGTHCEVEVEDQLVTEWLDRLLWRFAAAGDPKAAQFRFVVSSGPDGFDLRSDNDDLRTGLSREEAAMRLLVELNRETVSHLDGFAVHAAAVLGPEGAILLPGKSGAGKSTLAAACGRLGFGYMTDEIVVFLESGLIRPFPKPLWLSSWSRSILQVAESNLAFVAPGFKAPVPAEDTKASVVEDDVPLSHIVLIERTVHDTEIEIAPRSAGAAGVLGNAYHLGDRSGVAFAAAADAAREAFVLRLRVGDPHAGARALAEMVT